jgi:adenosylcobinamide amidohydrolase
VALPTTCACCEHPLDCGATDRTRPCWCTTVELGDPVRDRLAGMFDTCLCRPCLDAQTAVGGPERHERHEDGLDLPMQVWRFGTPRMVMSSGPVGGGLGLRHWVLNAQVRDGYARVDLHAHVADLARLAQLDGPGVGLLTAASADAVSASQEAGVRVWSTVGISHPIRAADSDDWSGTDSAPGDGPTAPSPRVTPAGTINTVVDLPVPLEAAAMVNLVVTATEAKAQALTEAGFDATGTATDAICVVTPPPDGRPPEAFGGPRSRWGSRVARAVHSSVAAGAEVWISRG